MSTAKFNKKILEGWWNLLRHLSAEARIELASRLINSLKDEEPKNDSKNWESLFGSWDEENMPAKNMATFVRESRVSYRKNESFDLIIY